MTTLSTTGDTADTGEKTHEGFVLGVPRVPRGGEV